ncbi:MAG: sulfatase-like hydrolase/transferase [Lentisphaeraceae bacterium]|nr:sulfatase-like hydrolase/transferase [Lentisphaeraceae bacterium]
MKIFCVVVMLLLSLSGYSQEKPNVILVFIDDMGWADFSCFGNKDAKTVEIDKLAGEGICFEQFYVNSPICSPSRVAVSTGQYPQRWDITSYLNNRQSNEKRGIANWLDPKAPMLARSLKENGYMTGHFGKWHMGGQRDVGEAPLITEYGFDESLTNFEGLGPRLLPLVRTPKKPEFRKIWAGSEKLGRGKVTWMDRSKITGGFVDAAVKFIDKAKEAEKPFYINLWPDDVHSPFFPTLEGWKKGGDKRNLYLSVLKEMDTQLGILFEKIKSDEKLKNNTLILICSDNGHEPGAGRSGPLRGMKTNLFEGGIRSSLVVWGPGLIPKEKQGTRNKSSLFSAIDLVPSILELTGTESSAIYDGETLSETLIGKSSKSRSRAIFYRRPPDRKYFYGSTNPDLAVRKRDWKLLCDFDGSNTSLYKITDDHGEKNNVAEQNPEIVKELKAELMSWNESIPKDNPEAHVKKGKKK